MLKFDGMAYGHPFILSIIHALLHLSQQDSQVPGHPGPNLPDNVVLFPMCGVKPITSGIFQ